MIKINDQITLDPSDLTESFVRSTGPGGQNVNKVSTAVQLRFDARRSPALSNTIYLRLAKLAGSKLSKDGYILMPTLPGLGEDINFDYIAERTGATH